MKSSLFGNSIAMEMNRTVLTPFERLENVRGDKLAADLSFGTRPGETAKSAA